MEQVIMELSVLIIYQKNPRKERKVRKMKKRTKG